MNSVPKLFSCYYADCWPENHFSTEFGVLTPNHTHSHTLFWGAFQGGSGERLHGMQEVTGSIPVFSTKKSTVLRRKYSAFLFAEAGFWWATLLRLRCFQAFAGGSYTTPQILTLHHFQKGMFAARFFSRLSHRSNQGSYGCVKG